MSTVRTGVVSHDTSGRHLYLLKFFSRQVTRFGKSIIINLQNLKLFGEAARGASAHLTRHNKRHDSNTRDMLKTAEMLLR